MKYSYKKNGGRYDVIHTEDKEETVIAATITAEIADLLCKALNSFSGKDLTDDQKADIISRVVAKYELSVMNLGHDLFTSEYREKKNSLLAKIYDQYFRKMVTP